MAVQGRVSDARGRLLDGTVTVSKDGVAIGRASTAGGRFVLYDLPTGALTFTLRTPTGATGSATGRYLGETITVNITAR